MDFRIRLQRESTRRSRIPIKNINQLLDNKQIISVPQQNLKNTFQSIKPSSLHKQEQHRSNKSIVKLRLRSKSNVQSPTSQTKMSLSLFKNNRINHKIMYNNTGTNFRGGWTPERSAQLVKRTTMPQFRFKSLQTFREQNYVRNTMWKPIHYIKSPNKLQKSKIQSSSNHKQQVNQKQQIKKPHQFLKKGSNINKRVVVNLLKIKLNQKANNSQRIHLNKQQNQIYDDTIKNQQILRMIKIYKGYGQSADAISSQRYKKIKELKLYQSQKSFNEQIDLKKQLKIKPFPFQNINIQLSVSKWNERREENDNYNQCGIQQHV